MSVATSTSTCPLLKRYIMSSRWLWSRSECISPQLMCICLSERLISFTLSFEPANTITRLSSLFWNKWRMMPNFWFSWHT